MERGAVERQVVDQDRDLDVAAARGGSDCPSGSLSLRGSEGGESRFTRERDAHAPLPNSIGVGKIFTLSRGWRGGPQSSARERAEGASAV